MSGISARLRAARILARTYGRKGVTRRARHELRRALGMFRTSPTPNAPATVSTSTINYGPSGGWDTVPSRCKVEALARARRVVEGEFQAYGHDWRPLPRSSIDWRTHGASLYAYEGSAWWRIAHLGPAADIKDVWEPGRFTWMYELVRAYALTGDAEFSDAAHARIAEFVDANPPFSGVQWSCGQETAIRALALLHAESALPLPVGDPEGARKRLAQLLWWSGERIEDAIEYGLSQRNNHGISEAAGLVHLGLRFRNEHPRAAAWLRTGLRHITEQIVDQFSLDGWYAQHSFTYMRLAMDQALLVQHALVSQGLTLPAEVTERLEAAMALLTEVIDGTTGVVPNHGANDGARLVVYSTAEYRDFRPLLTLASLVLAVPVPADIAIDPEVVCWLGMPMPQACAPRVDGVRQGSSGWAHARVGRANVFLRAGEYSHRPSHLDPLHIDVRFGSQEIVTDAGSYAYNAPDPWRNALQSARLHNGPLINDQEPAERGPRFLWYSWPVARVVAATFANGKARLVGATDAARREIEVCDDQVVVADFVSDAASAMQVTWLLHPLAAPDQIVAEGAEVLHASEGSVEGWFSPSYGLRVASRAVRLRTTQPGALITVIHPAAREDRDR